jgi:hypothetical protein
MDRMEFISQIVHIFALDHLVHYTTREGQPQPCASVQDPASATGLHAALAAGHSRESSEAAIPERAVFTSSVSRNQFLCRTVPHVRSLTYGPCTPAAHVPASARHGHYGRRTPLPYEMCGLTTNDARALRSVSKLIPSSDG